MTIAKAYKRKNSMWKRKSLLYSYIVDELQKSVAKKNKKQMNISQSNSSANMPKFNTTKSC